MRNMGFFLCFCFPSPPPMSSRRRRTARLVLWGGETRAAEHGRLAGEVMFEFPDSVVCRADEFFLGRPAPVLAIEDALAAGRAYFVLPVDRLPPGRDALTAASLPALVHDTARQPPLAGGGGGSQSPFEYVKGDDGRTVIKVTPEFISSAIMARGGGGGGAAEEGSASCALCSTPELRKHYAQLVGPRERPWSPRLETIKERKGGLRPALSPARLSPVRLLGFEKGRR